MDVPTLSDACVGGMRTARERYHSGDFTAAEALLRHILEDPEQDGHATRDEAISMLAAASWELGKWEQADKLFDLQFKGRASLMERLTRQAIETQRDGAERLLRKHFEGREPLIELLAETYVRDGLWEKSRPLLTELLHCETDQNTRVERMHALAYVCFAEGNLREAEAWCLKTILGGENEAVTLLARIYNTGNMDHEAYEIVLGELSPGVQGITPDTTFLIRMC
jgi:hypothetical protein